jgi:hypothetical protein
MITEHKQIEMCGETFAQLEEGLANALGHKMIYVMGFLSDAQHMIAHGDKEGARQILNAAKYLMSIMMDADLNKSRG